MAMTLRRLSSGLLGRQVPRSFVRQAACALSTAREPPKTTFKEILDRTTSILFLTEIFRGFWLALEVGAKPKVRNVTGMKAIIYVVIIVRVVFILQRDWGV